MQVFNKISFYVVAHADDWQLFMQPGAYNDLVTPGCKTVFIVITAGDAGMDETFWKAREEGMKSSVRICLAPAFRLEEQHIKKKIGNHYIFCWDVAATRTYFLRLPDGGLEGNGFPGNRNQSLLQFNKRDFPIQTVDDVNSYCCWQDLLATMDLILAREMIEGCSCSIKYMNPDVEQNPGDHPDHIATGMLVKGLSCIHRVEQRLFTGYSSCNHGLLLPPAQLTWKAAVFAAYEKAVYDACGYSTLGENVDLYQQWLTGCAPCQVIPPVQ